jgi:cytochrome bd ubiquinol oxidase subunit II
MNTLWFWIVAVMFAIFAVIDGFDMGVGIIHLIITRSDSERSTLLESIAPVWDGNEVWLIAGGGALFFAFPGAYASGFSGFYLPLIMVLWLLILRGIAIEFRNHIDSPVWIPFWDVIFSGASALLALFFGVALGNVIRGIPLDANDSFFLPLWTDFRISSAPGVLDWFTIALGLTSLVALALQGCLWVAMRTSGDLQTRARDLARLMWVVTLVLTIAVMIVVPLTLPHFSVRYLTRPLGLILPIAALGALIGVRISNGAGSGQTAFLCSSGYILAMLAAAAFGHYPNLLPAISGTESSLTIYNASTTSYGLSIGLAWFIPGILLVGGYFLFAYRHAFARPAHNV